MRRALKVFGLSGLLATGIGSAQAFADVPKDADPQENTEQPKQAEGPGPLAPAPAAVAVAVAPAAASLASPAKPKFGDMATSGYFRGGFGASSQKGRMTCFGLGLTGGQISKYRLGNECEVWSETHFTMVVYANDDGSVATFHFMPTIFIPTDNIGYSPRATTSSPAPFTSSTGATVSFPNLYVDLQHIPWLAGGTAWIGTRYYKREAIYISDFFYWNPSGVGAGIEDVHLGDDLRLSYAAFAVDGVLAPVDSTPTSPSFPDKRDFGVRNDVQLRGIRPYASGEIQIGFQYIANYSSDPAPTSGGWGATIQWVHKALGGDNRLAFQYGRGGGTGFGTLARFYYPDFSLHHDPNEWRIRALDVLTIQPTPWLGAQVAGVFQRDDLASMGKADWYSAGGRVSVGISEHFKLLGEVGYDYLKKGGNSAAQTLTKATIAPTISAGRGLLNRPELRIFYTWATWSETAQGMGVDSSKIYNMYYSDYRSGATFGLQAETWW